MARRALLLLGPVALLGGCLEQPGTKLVSPSPFAAPPSAPAARANYAPASLEAATRVDTISRQILAANAQTGLRPIFRTIGTPEAEIFHQNTTEIDITEGLVKQCSTDGQLAAVLCQELGSMMAERETLAGPAARSPDRAPPMNVPVGNTNGSYGGSSDQTHLAELGMYERERRHVAPSGAPPVPDARTLARAYLTKTGYPTTDLDDVQPLLQKAAQNTTFARQLKGAALPMTHSWTAP